MHPTARIVVFGALFALVPSGGLAFSDIVNTRHNLSVSGPGTVRALTETRICVFCHTPHNATPQTPLWNKEIGPRAYTFYTSPTLKSPVPVQPTGATKLCLSCHDGTTAIGAVVNPSGGITMSGSGWFPPTSLSNIGLDLSSHHPVSISYSSALPNSELSPTPPPNLVFGAVDELQCTTCHDPHNDANSKFLVMNNRYSALCTSCHKINGWEVSSHATSEMAVPSGVLPVPPRTWPTLQDWPTVAEWGCEVCHAPHFAATPQWLLNYTSSDFCLSCHGAEGGTPHAASIPAVAAQQDISADRPSAFRGEGRLASCRTCHGMERGSPHIAPVAPVVTPMKASFAQASAPQRVVRTANIRAQMRKLSNHGGRSGVGDLLHHPKESPRPAVRHVTCVDCHNPHLARRQKAFAPNAPGSFRGVKGVDRNGVGKASVAYEYEVCFRCHADYNPGMPYVLRVVDTSNLRVALDTVNPSYHPVVGMGRNLNIPSIPSSFEPSLTASSLMYCTDCHGDDSGGSRGPHGSSYPPILRERYEMTDGTPERYESYALCYRCHERNSILGDQSFRKKSLKTTATGGGHSGHLAKGATCSACHDPHGVVPDNRPSGNHTHLINFDTRIASPPTQGPNSFPVFTDTGTFSGNCTLVCHGVTHTNTSYP